MLNPLKALYSQFKNGKLTKALYIRKMHGIHKILWEYQNFIQDKNVSSIKISKDDITLTTKSGIVLICDPLDERALPIEILNFGDYEDTEMRMIKQFLHSNAVVLDIGANMGWYSLNLSKAVPSGSVIAFEPIKRTFEHLKKNIALNGFKNIRVYNFGLSDKKGVFELYYDPKLTGAASLKDLYKGSKKEKIRCQLKRLDDFIFKITPHIDFIKCDVEGAELFVVKGALEVLKKTKPVLFLEMLRKWSAKFGYHPNDLIRLLDGIGYNCYYAKGAGLVRIEKVYDSTKPTNFFFLDPKKHKRYIEELT